MAGLPERAADPPETTRLPQAPARTRRRRWFGWGLAAFILIACAIWLDLGEVGRTLARLHPAAALGIILLVALDRVVMAWKWRLLLAVGDVRLPLAQVVRLYFQGSMAGLFMPSMLGGDLLRGWWAAQASGKTAFVFASLAMERMIGILSATLWGIAGAVVFASWRWPDRLWLWIALGALAALGLVLLFVLSLHPRVHALILGGLGRFRTRKLVGILEKLYAAYAHFSTVPATLGRNFLIAQAEHLLQMLVYLAIALALGVATQPVLFVAVAALHTLIMRIPVAPEGWGVGEVSAIGLYGLIGVGAETAFAIMITFRVVVLIACSPGLVFLVRPAQTA